MKIGNIWSVCKVILASMIVVSSVAQVSLGQGLVCTVTGSNFQLNAPCTVTKIEISHTKGGQYGSIKLNDALGNEYGPWSADTSSSKWVVYPYPSAYLAAGSYRLVDSDPATYQGQAWIYGSVQGPTPTPTRPAKPTTPW